MHTPVLCAQVIDHFDKLYGKKIIDCTLGEGGHTLEMAKRGAKVLAIDADEEQIKRFIKSNSKSISEYKIEVVRSNYSDIVEVANANNFTNCDGILFDLGLSMNQIHSDQGFTYKNRHQPLHMLVDTVRAKMGAAKAADVLAYISEYEFADILERYSEVRDAQKIASNFVRGRSKKSILTVGDLCDALGDEIENSQLAQIFQAIRIHVNDEIEGIRKGLKESLEVLKTGGVLQIITFHSVEDRLVKTWSKTVGLKEIDRVIGRNVSRSSFEKSAVLRIYQKI